MRVPKGLEYLLAALDNDMELTIQVAQRLSGISITFSRKQINRLVAQVMILEGKDRHEVLRDSGVSLRTYNRIQDEIFEDSYMYYEGVEKAIENYKKEFGWKMK